MYTILNYLDSSHKSTTGPYTYRFLNKPSLYVFFSPFPANVSSVIYDYVHIVRNASDISSALMYAVGLMFI